MGNQGFNDEREPISLGQILYDSVGHCDKSESSLVS